MRSARLVKFPQHLIRSGPVAHGKLTRLLNTSHFLCQVLVSGPLAE